jgi:hypothetical protein
MQYLYAFFVTVLLVPFAQSVMMTQTITDNEFGNALFNLSTEMKGFISNATETTPSIGDAMTTSSSISNLTEP